MIGIVIAMHGRLASALKKETERMIGKQDDFYAFDLNEEFSPEGYVENLKRLVGDKEFLILVDFYGGTPCNCSLKVFSVCKNIRVISGVNFPMVLSALTRRRKNPIDKLAEIVCDEGKKSIKEIIGDIID